jgi:hypothetical protein
MQFADAWDATVARFKAVSMMSGNKIDLARSWNIQMESTIAEDLHSEFFACQCQ